MAIAILSIVNFLLLIILAASILEVNARIDDLQQVIAEMYIKRWNDMIKELGLDKLEEQEGMK